jgi:hypothetical protein
MGCCLKTVLLLVLNYVVSKTPLGCTAPFNRLGRGRFNRPKGPRVGDVESAQDFIRSVLQPCVRLVQLTGCLASQLTELVAIGHMRECPKNQIGTHCHCLLLIEPARLVPLDAAGAARGANSIEGYPKVLLSILRRKTTTSSSKILTHFRAI